MSAPVQEFIEECDCFHCKERSHKSVSKNYVFYYIFQFIDEINASTFARLSHIS